MTRKERLKQRAQSFADRPYDTDGADEMAQAFEAGYRAAMRDARKEAGTDDDEFDYVRLQRVLRWLRPLR